MPLDYDPSPVNPLPPIVIALFFALFGVECLFALGEAGMIGGPSAVGWRLGAIRDYGFSGQAFDFMVANGLLLPEHLLRLVTYPFLHGGFTAALFAGVILLAMGKLVGEVMGQVAVVTIFFASSILGAIVFGLVTDEAWLIGGFTGVYGLIGGYTFLAWQQLAGRGMQQLGAFRLIGILMAIQLIFGIFVEVGYSWVAELSGFIVGFVISPLLVRGGLARVLNRLRQR